MRREELNKIHLTPSFSVQLVITSFTGWFLTQKSYVSELMKVIHASLSDLFQDWSVTCWRCCWFKFRSCWIMPCRLYPGKVIIEVPLKSTRYVDGIFKWHPDSQSSSAHSFLGNKGITAQRQHGALSLLSCLAGGIKEAALCGVKQQHQAQRWACWECIFMFVPLSSRLFSSHFMSLGVLGKYYSELYYDKHTT